MKINDKHKYDVDIIEIKLFLDKISSKTFDEVVVVVLFTVFSFELYKLTQTIEKQRYYN